MSKIVCVLSGKIKAVYIASVRIDSLVFKNISKKSVPSFFKR